MEVLLCKRVNDLGQSLFHLLNCLITTAFNIFLELWEKAKVTGSKVWRVMNLSWCPPFSNSVWQGWSRGLVHCPGGNATDPIWRVLAPSDRISSWTPLKPQHSIPCWLYVQRKPSACRSCQCCQKKGSSNVCGWICSVWASCVWESQHASSGNSVSRSLGHSSRSSFHRRSPEHQELLDLNWSAQPSPCCHDNVFLSDLLWAPLGQTSSKSSASSVPRE